MGEIVKPSLDNLFLSGTKFYEFELDRSTT